MIANDADAFQSIESSAVFCANGTMVLPSRLVFGKKLGCAKPLLLLNLIEVF
jgi:hypothetical protein